MRPGGQLDRALAALTIGPILSEKHRRQALRDTHTSAKHQLIQLPVTGQAGTGWGFSRQKVKWEQPFLYAPGQWLVPFQTPHFHANFDVLGSGGQSLLLDAKVVGWKVLEEGWTVGATIEIGACAPNATAAVSFSAVAHLTFTGYAAAAEAGEFAH
jgi:hypothetical protein